MCFTEEVSESESRQVSADLRLSGVRPRVCNGKLRSTRTGTPPCCHFPPVHGGRRGPGRNSGCPSSWLPVNLYSVLSHGPFPNHASHVPLRPRPQGPREEWCLTKTSDQSCHWMMMSRSSEPMDGHVPGPGQGLEGLWVCACMCIRAPVCECEHMCMSVLVWV